MIFENTKEFMVQLKRNTRIMGIDFGTKNIGIALSDRGWNIATAKIIIARKGNQYVIQKLNEMIIENDVSGLVFGLPLNLQGDETAFCGVIRDFVGKLAKIVNIPICFYDEFLTSDTAKSIIIGDLSGNFKKMKNNVDKVAATVILQGFLDNVNLLLFQSKPEA
jgi:putative Holliday junction resolvase